jgi:hypothetical protein
MRDILTIRCVRGWRGLVCILDNLVPHKPDPDEGALRDDELPALIGRRGLAWVCRLHDRVLR